jgi:hypothetical protein
MKLLILFGAVSVAVYLVWLGWTFLKGLGAAYGNASSSTGPGDIAWVLIVVGIATAGCVIASFFVPAGAGKIVALAPIALVLAGQGFIAWQEKVRWDRYEQEQEFNQSALGQRILAMPKDYQLKVDFTGGRGQPKYSFMTIDRGVIVRVDVGAQCDVRAHPVGRIKGKELETLEQGEGFEKTYRWYWDREGNSILENYTIKHRPDQPLEDYRLDRFKP